MLTSLDLCLNPSTYAGMNGFNLCLYVCTLSPSSDHLWKYTRLWSAETGSEGH